MSILRIEIPFGEGTADVVIRYTPGFPATDTTPEEYAECTLCKVIVGGIDIGTELCGLQTVHGEDLDDVLLQRAMTIYYRDYEP